MSQEVDPKLQKKLIFKTDESVKDRSKKLL